MKYAVRYCTMFIVMYSVMNSTNTVEYLKSQLEPDMFDPLRSASIFFKMHMGPCILVTHGYLGLGGDL